jgi:hypothetical protein
VRGSRGFSPHERHAHAVEDAAAALRLDSKTGVVDASLAAILQEIAQRMERDRKQQREAMARIMAELRLLRAMLRRERRGRGGRRRGADRVS